MDLLIVLFIAGVAGYYLSKSRYSEHIDSTTAKVATKSEDLLDKTKGWWRRRFRKGKQQNDFIGWATGTGAVYFSEDLCVWWQSLPPNEAEQYSQALRSYAESLGFHVDELIKGEMNSKPALLQVFVEAIVMYSNEYRVARQALAEAKRVEPAPTDGKSVAEKQASRRKGSVDSTQSSASV
jgi:hypothetical protein